MLQLRLMRRELVKLDEVNELIDGLFGRGADGFVEHARAVRAAWRSRDPGNIERVFEVRTEKAKVCQEMADKNGEPPLDKQGADTVDR